MKNLIVISLYSAIALIPNLSRAEECNLYIGFTKSQGNYVIDKASKNFIDESNVLLYRFDIVSESVIEVKLPMQSNDADKCSLAYSNQGKMPSCSGYFVKEKVAGSVARNVLMTVGTLGIRTVKTGGIYKTEPNLENIDQAVNNSNIFTNPQIESLIKGCNKY